MPRTPADVPTEREATGPEAAPRARARILSIDAARGVAIALVVLTHAATRSLGQPVAEQLLWYRAVVAFDMPLFMFVAGYLLFRPALPPVGAIARSRARSLLIPYAAWMTINAATDAIASPSVGLQRLLLGIVDPRVGGPWFLYVLFECIVVFALLARASRSSWWLVASTLAIALVLTLVGPRDGTLLGKSDVQFLLPFVALGFAYAKHRPSWRMPDWVLAVGALVLFAGLCLLTLVPSFDAAWRAALVQTGVPGAVVDVASRLLRYVTGLTGSIGVLASAHLLRGRLARVTAALGVASLGIYVVHSTMLMLLLSVPGMPLLIAAAAALALSFVAVLLLERWAPTCVLLLGIRAPRFTGRGPWADEVAEG
jgi:fucose 4-O-acetylase-like acetyltransferase